MQYEVRLAHEADGDLEEIFDYIVEHDGPERAEHVAGRIEAMFRALEALPYRGTVPRDLAACGVTDCREVRFKPYRIIYTVTPPYVDVLIVADGRRDMSALVQARMTRP